MKDAFLHPMLGSRVVGVYPVESTNFPQFYPLQTTLKGMYSNTINIHPNTREMLALLDKYEMSC